MRTVRLYQPGLYQAGQTLALSKDRMHYALNVLRLKSGQAITAFNGEGQLAEAILAVNSRRDAQLNVLSVEPCIAKTPLQTTLVQAISRGDRMDHSIQKAVELGVTTIQPVFSAHCEVKLNSDKREKRRQQWQNIVINACEQSGQNRVPKVETIQTYSEWLSQFTSTPFYCICLDPLASKALPDLPQPEANQPVHILVGPEGGLTAEEIEQAQNAGAFDIKLGPRILRTETAGPALLAILQAKWGDLSGLQ